MLFPNELTEAAYDFSLGIGIILANGYADRAALREWPANASKLRGLVGQNQGPAADARSARQGVRSPQMQEMHSG